MTPKELRTALVRLHWTQRGLAAQLGVAHNTVARWAVGTAPIPANVASWLGALAAHHKANPPPIYQPASWAA